MNSLIGELTDSLNYDVNVLICLISVLKNVEMNVDNAEDCGGYDIKIVVVQGSKRCTVDHKDAHKVKLVV